MATTTLVSFLLVAVGTSPPPAPQDRASADAAIDKPADAKSSEASDGATEPAMDFDLFDDRGSGERLAVDPELERLAERRRTLLTYHQMAGMGTLVAMAAATVLGQMNYNDRYGGGSGSDAYVWPHRAAVILTTVELATAGSLALLAPEPYEKEVAGRGFSTATVHKAGTAVAALGMVAQLGLGLYVARQARSDQPVDLGRLASIHQAVGYGTMGVLTVAAAAWLF